ncbi:MAG: peptide ABC transporter permease [Halobacteriovoraceae bacterium]|nr:peptide ABC transporter permease [Halobacteriovoraceae bacterium]|tara:strand:- start:147303 stop:148325 length:1023 start_codon:yes stop_codon:yes gene_type:complete
MIEKRIKNEQTLKKWRTFKRKKAAWISLWLIVASCFFSFTAEFWANSKPLVINYKGETYFPVFKEYSAKDFGITDSLFVDYKGLELSNDDWVVWPLVKWDPYQSNKNVDEYPAPPSSENIMGTDDRGRDVFTRLLYGFRYSIAFAIFVWIITFIVGVLLGSLQGYMGGRMDLYMQRITEVLSTVPQLFLLIILIAVFQPSLALLIIIYSLFGWIPISYYMRAEFLKNRKKEYVEAARALGAGHGRVFFKHILPNSLAPIITFSPFAIVANISALAALDYLGFGLTPPTPSWGELLAQAQNNFTIGWWLALFPSLALFCALTFFSLIGEGIRDAMDPHQRE